MDFSKFQSHLSNLDKLEFRTPTRPLVPLLFPTQIAGARLRAGQHDLAITCFYTRSYAVSVLVIRVGGSLQTVVKMFTDVLRTFCMLRELLARRSAGWPVRPCQTQTGSCPALSPFLFAPIFLGLALDRRVHPTIPDRSGTRHRSDCGMHPQWQSLGSRIEYKVARPRVDSARGGPGCVVHGGTHQSLGKHCESLPAEVRARPDAGSPVVRKADDLALATS